jgi:hypothetical protein
MQDVVCFLLGNSLVSEFYMPTFRNTLFHLHKQGRYEEFFISTHLWRWNRQCVTKRRHIKFRRQGITQKKAYNIQNKAKFWNQESYASSYPWLVKCSPYHVLSIIAVYTHTVLTYGVFLWGCSDYVIAGTHDTTHMLSTLINFVYRCQTVKL